MAVTEKQVIEVYLATFNRAADKAGLDYWVNDSGLNIEQIAKSFFDQPETKALYPEDNTNNDFVISIYDNLFGREPDDAGLAYWIAELDNGKDRSVMIEMVKNGATGDDAKLIANKTAVAQKFVDDGLNNTAQSKSIFDGITADEATITQAMDSITQSIETIDLNNLTDGSVVDGGFTLFESPAYDDKITNIEIILPEETLSKGDLMPKIPNLDELADAGDASINKDGLAYFAREDNRSLALQVVAVEKAIQSNIPTVGEFAFFESDAEGSINSYIFISDGVDGVSEDDLVIKLTGVTDLAQSSIGDGNIVLS